MSLTVITINENKVLITLIPYTHQVTVVQCYQVGQLLNIEVDMMAKYIEKLINPFVGWIRREKVVEE